ncbi:MULTISPECIES: GNAT family N-acetyltransferase [unclassified Devosia]|uniref:GNAT family N-acetyltransferase n=1 Tax=unclassified Devosia TaxID=196773 RepID=UPI00145F418F|nr:MULTISPECIES: GNAT family N-acetyltransferase [unclassified Devosia]MBJ6987056.1 GNAT family N-acetyltransferase [Devosia sp. MC521]MBJ7577252.1 GNAT family N-acetyltransferase [Devosia sp. MC532]QMW62680.1 GNAT family N-acetyltransferase [Devosia sp. MC521]
MIRAIEQSDHRVWTQLWTAYLQFYETVLPQEVFASTWSRLLDPNEPTWGALALQDGQPIGLVHWLYHRTNWAVADNCYLQDLYVMPEGRGGGHGRALIEHVATIARARPCAQLYWTTHKTNTTAMQLYDRLASQTGFVPYRMTLSV